MIIRSGQSKLKKELDLENNADLFMETESVLHLNKAEDKEKQYEDLELALGQLNEEQKKCLDLFYFKDKSYVEIAEITGLTNNEVKSHIQNGKRNLKIKLEHITGKVQS